MKLCLPKIVFLIVRCCNNFLTAWTIFCIQFGFVTWKIPLSQNMSLVCFDLRGRHFKRGCSFWHLKTRFPWHSKIVLFTLLPKPLAPILLLDTWFLSSSTMIFCWALFLIMKWSVFVRVVTGIWRVHITATCILV